MNSDEIKENNFSEMLFNRDERLLDYITNLQDQVNALVNVKDKLLEENEYLRTDLNTFENTIIEVNKECNSLFNHLTKKDLDYKSRVEKAVEYINKNKHLSMFADCREPEEEWNYDLEINPRDLLNILQGENNG